MNYLRSIPAVKRDVTDVIFLAELFYELLDEAIMNDIDLGRFEAALFSPDYTPADYTYKKMVYDGTESTVRTAYSKLYNYTTDSVDVSLSKKRRLSTAILATVRTSR